VSGGFLLLRAFFQWKIEHKLSTIFFLFHSFFWNHFHTDGLNLSYAQMHNTAVLLLYCQESRSDICLSARLKVNCQVMPQQSFANF